MFHVLRSRVSSQVCAFVSVYQSASAPWHLNHKVEKHVNLLMECEEQIRKCKTSLSVHWIY